MNGAQSLFKALVDADITTCFANPGTSEMQLVYEIGMTDKVRPVLCLQEDVVTGAADGYARMTGAPAFTLLHVGSGFGNGIAMLHNAGRANTPMVNVVGANATYHQPNNPEHELINGHITDLARVVSHWAKEARNATELGELGAEAAALAKTGRICTIVAPTNCHWDEANPPPVFSAPLERQKTSAEAIAHAATMLKGGKKLAWFWGIWPCTERRWTSPDASLPKPARRCYRKFFRRITFHVAKGARTSSPSLTNTKSALSSCNPSSS